MANEEHVEVVKKGADAIAEWRSAHSGMRLDLIDADLSGVDLSGAKLSGANLIGAKLNGAHLSLANLRLAKLGSATLVGAYLSGADFRGADLRGVDLQGAGLWGANLVEANLVDGRLIRANLSDASLSGADLSNADLSDADLTGASLRDASLIGANLSDTKLGDTVFYRCDLSQTKGLNRCSHRGSSSVSFETQVTIPAKLREHFLRGCGLPQSYIEYLPALVGSLSPIDFYSVFISHSSKDKDFARQLEASLQQKGVRCWLDEKMILPGDDIDKAIDHGIKVWDYVILCCSKDALTSWWVDDELNHAFVKEKRLSKGSDHTRCVIPLTLDDYVFDEWDHHYKNRVTRLNVADFRDWKNHDSYREQFERVVKKLRADAGGLEPDPEPKLGR